MNWYSTAQLCKYCKSDYYFKGRCERCGDHGSLSLIDIEKASCEDLAFELLKLKEREKKLKQENIKRLQTLAMLDGKIP